MSHSNSSSFSSARKGDDRKSSQEQKFGGSIDLGWGTGTNSNNLKAQKAGKMDVGRKGKALTKKAKRKGKTRQFLKKLESQQPKASSRVANKASRAPRPLDALGDIKTSLKEIQKAPKAVKVRGGKQLSSRQRRRQMNAEVTNFVAVMQHPVFQKAPLETVREHLTNSIRAKQEEEIGIDARMD